MTKHETAVPARDRLFALIASIPGSGTVDWCSPARALLDEIAAVSVPPPAPQAADRRARYAAAIAEGFAAFDADTTSDAYLDAELLDAVVAVADAEEAELLAAVPVVPPATNRAALRDRIRRALCEASGNGFMWGTDMLEPDEYGDAADAVLAVLPEAADRAAVCICGHSEAQHFEDACVTEVTGCDCGDFLTGEAAREVIARWRDAATRMANDADLPGRLEAALTERFTELGNPFSAMRRQEQGPDGWPASHPVGPHHVAGVLRELLDGGPCVAGEQQNETPEAPVCGRTKSVAGTEYPPCGREPGHEEAYCRSADGKQHFLAVGYDDYERTTGHLITCLAVAGGGSDPDCPCARPHP